MANTDNAFGLKPVRYLSGAPYNGACNMYYVPSTDTTAAIYIGSLVKLAGGADADGVATVTQADTTNEFVGVVVGVQASTAGSTTYRANSTSRYVWVADDPNLLFEIQEDGVTTPVAAASVGLNADFVSQGGSTVTGLSTIELDSDSVATTATLDFAIFGLVNRADNVIGANAKWLVRLLNHQYKDSTTGVS